MLAVSESPSVRENSGSEAVLQEMAASAQPQGGPRGPSIPEHPPSSALPVHLSPQ